MKKAEKGEDVVERKRQITEHNRAAEAHREQVEDGDGVDDIYIERIGEYLSFN